MFVLFFSFKCSDLEIGEKERSPSLPPSYGHSFLSQVDSVGPHGLSRWTKVTVGMWVKAADICLISFWALEARNQAKEVQWRSWL